MILVISATAGLASCRSGDVPKPEGLRDPLPVATATAMETTRAVNGPTGTRPSNSVEFPDVIEWHTWEEGLRLAKAQNKPMMVVVYADWCPKCRALTPVFASAEVKELSKQLIVVRQNHDDDPAWLQTYNQKYGGYVPRIFFFDPQGNIREDVTSGHPRYPYFYAAQQAEFLTRSMRLAIGR